MKRKGIALLLTSALLLSLCVVSASADEMTKEKAGAKTGELAAAPGALVEEVTVVPDRVGTVSLENLEQRMRENCLDMLILQTSIDSLEDMDYEGMQEDLRKALNGIANAQWYLINVSQSDSVAYAQMQQQYTALDEQFEALRKGDLQAENADLVRQLRAGQDQIVLLGETTYITLAALETQEGALQRQLEALNRTVEEMELRYELGQVSAMQLTEVKAGRTALVSGLETLQMNIKNLKTQIEMLLGAELTGEIQLVPVPEVTEQQLAAMDVEEDLLTAKDRSYTLYDAAQTLADARDTYVKSSASYGFNESEAMYRAARRTWEAAQYTYNNTVRSFEMSFRQLHAQVLDHSQALEAARVSLASEELAFEAAGLKYRQGTISQNAYLSAQDDLEAAEEKVQTAANDLFSAYNTYCWAVERGILN